MATKKIKKIKRLAIFGLVKQYWKVVYITITDKRTPTVLRLLLLGAIVYIASPIDLLPDVIPLLGQIDDIGIAIAVLEYIKKTLPPSMQDELDGKVIDGDTL